MPSCSVLKCRNRSVKKNYKTDGVTYHTFPNNPKFKEKWINATGREPNWFPVKRNSVICSEHFEEKCFQPLAKSRRLFEWAVPTINLCNICHVCQVCGSALSSNPLTLEDRPVEEVNNASINKNEIAPDPVSPKDNSDEEDNKASIKENVFQVFLDSLTSKDCSDEKATADSTATITKIVPDYTCVTCGGHDIVSSAQYESSQTVVLSNNLPETKREREMSQKINKYENLMKVKRTQIKNLQKTNFRYRMKIKKYENILKTIANRKLPKKPST